MNSNPTVRTRSSGRLNQRTSLVFFLLLCLLPPLLGAERTKLATGDRVKKIECASSSPSPTENFKTHVNAVLVIDRIQVSDCYQDPVTGASVADLNVEISWTGTPPGPPFTASTAGPRRDRIAVEVAGQTNFAFLESPYVNRDENIQGYYELSSPQLVNFTVPADGATAQTVNVYFTSDPGNDVIDTYDRPVACPPDPCLPTSGTVGGVVFEDLNLNGTRDPGEPTGLQGVMVELYGCDATGATILLGTAVTDVDGNYYFDATNTSPPVSDGQDYRIEFTQPPGTVLEATCGQQNGYTTVQFGTAPRCGFNLGLVDPSVSCQETPDVLLTCYVSGQSAGSSGPNSVTILSFPYDAQDDNFGFNNGNDQGSANEAYGYHNQTGAVWGLAYRPADSLLFSGAVLRRHTGLGPLGLGGLYVTDFTQPQGTNGTNAPTSSFLDLSFGGAYDFGGPIVRTQLGTTPTDDDNRDPVSFPLIGTVGLGDVEISADGNTLYTLNLFTKELFAVDISGYDGTPATTPTQNDLTVTPLPNPCGGTGELRPWALKIRGDGLLVGFVCDGSVTDDRSDLRAYVYQFNTSSGNFDSNPALDFPLTYPRGAGSMNPGLWEHNVWEPWSNNFDGNGTDGKPWYRINSSQRINGQQLRVYDYPQPILADIEIDVDNTLVLVFNDRTSLQLGNRELMPTGSRPGTNTPAGDILRAFSPDGLTYILESNAVSGGQTGDGPGNFQGPGYGEFFNDNYFTSDELVHSEIVSGGAIIAPGSGQTIVATADPTDRTNFANGVRTYNNFTGQTANSYTVYTSDNQPTAPAFGKAAGLGDIELRCNPFNKLEIGNYVWLDENDDGVQDPCEPPISNVSVGLYATDGTLLATTTTNSVGEYYFSADGDVNQDWVRTGDGLEAMTDYLIVFGDGQFTTAGGLDLGNNESYELTVSNSAVGANADALDSDADETVFTSAMNDLSAGLPFISLTTGPSGRVDHTADVGFTNPCEVDLALTVPPVICRTTSLPLNDLMPTVAPSGTAAEWTSSGDGIFLASDGSAVGTTAPFLAAIAYRPGSLDGKRGQVELLLTTDPASSCGGLADTITVIIRNVDCGAFPWNGE